MTLVDRAAEDVCLRRVARSHRGIGDLQHIRRLWARAVDQNFLEEIATLKTLEVVHLDGVTATDLRALGNLPALRSLSVIGAAKVSQLDWLPQQASLRSLALENLPKVDDLGALSRLGQLTALAVEGSMWTAMHVATLKPLSDLRALQHLFLCNLQVVDQSLEPLHGLTQLRVLESAQFYPRQAFIALAGRNPSLSCQWFDAKNWD
jgi:internalin B